MHPLCRMYCVRRCASRCLLKRFEYFSVLLNTCPRAAFSQKPITIVFKNRLTIHSFSFHSKSDLSKDIKKKKKPLSQNWPKKLKINHVA